MLTGWGKPRRLGPMAYEHFESRIQNVIQRARIGAKMSFGKVLMVQTQNSAGEVNGTFAMKKMDMTFLRKKMRGNSFGGGGGGGADEMVKREIATMKKLHHPNIARLVDVVDDEETVEEQITFALKHNVLSVSGVVPVDASVTPLFQTKPGIAKVLQEKGVLKVVTP